MSASQKPVVVVGSINMDLVARSPKIPAPGETLIGTDFTQTPGGKGANQAVAVARLGYPVEMVGLVGEQGFADTLLGYLQNAGVGIEGMGRVPGASGVGVIVIAADAANSIVVIPGSNGLVTPAVVDAQAERIRGAGMVLCQLELPIETVVRVSEIAKEAGVPMMLDPAPAAKIPDVLWKNTSWVTPNETEAAFYLAGDELEPEQAAKQLLAKGVAGVVLKRGAEGSYLMESGGGAAWVTPFAVKAVDTVGAGDCFNGAFAVALLEGKDALTAAKFASAAAAVSVTRAGAQEAMPTRAEVEALIAASGRG
jgi:ribokinase